MATREDVSLMDVDDVIEFARDQLGQPEKILSKLMDAEVDGEALLLCTERNMDKVLPGIPAGPCLKLLSRLRTALSSSEPVISEDVVSDSQALTLIYPVSSESDNTDSEVEPPAAFQSSRASTMISPAQTMASPTTPRRSTTFPPTPRLFTPSPTSNIPFSGDFPIEKLVFGPVSQQAFATGIISREAKSDILQVLHNKIMQLSCEKSYGDRQIRLSAAEALVRRYPMLTEGRSLSAVVASWRKSLTEKGKTVRRSLNVEMDPRLEDNRQKHKIALSRRQAGGSRKRKITTPVLSEEDIEQLQRQQQELKAEMGKLKRDRNQRFICQLSEQTFPLRRMEIIENSPHLSQVLRDWPTLRHPDLIIKDLFWISGITLSDLKPIPADDILDYAEEYSTKLSRSHPMFKALHPQGRNRNDEVINDSIAVCCLPYFLPTKAKKTQLETHRFIIDLYPVDTPIDEVTRDLPGRVQPWILLRGAWTHVEKIQVVADGICVCTTASITEAVYTMVALYYIQDVEYNSQVKLAVKFLEQKVCCLPRVAQEDYKDVTSLCNILAQRNNKEN